MANSSAAPGDPGRAAPLRPEGRTSEPIVTDTGMELEAALPVVSPVSAAPAESQSQAAPISLEQLASQTTVGYLKSESPETVLQHDEKNQQHQREERERRPGDGGGVHLELGKNESNLQRMD